MRFSVKSLTLVAVFLGSVSQLPAQPGMPAMPGAGMPGGMPGMAPGMPGAMPGMNMGMPGGMPGMNMGMQQGQQGQQGQKPKEIKLEPTYVPGKALPWLSVDPESTASKEALAIEKEPVPLGEEGKQTAADAGTVPNKSAVISLASDADVHVFFYRELEDGEVRREKMRREDYDKLKENVVLALMLETMNKAQQNANQSQLQAGAALNNAAQWNQVNRTSGGNYGAETRQANQAATLSALRAALQGRAAQDYYSQYNSANWDFYFEQKELYFRYMRDTAFAGLKNELPEPTYSTSGVDRDQRDTKKQMESVAQDYATEQRNEVLDFFDRLEKREDHRRAYVAWVEDQKHRVVEQASIAARRYNSRTWDTGNAPSNTDNWYRKVNPANPAGIAVKVDGQEYVYSKDEAEGLNKTQLGIRSTALTPYDYVGPDGRQIKQEAAPQLSPLPADVPTGRRYDLLNAE